MRKTLLLTFALLAFNATHGSADPCESVLINSATDINWSSSKFKEQMEREINRGLDLHGGKSKMKGRERLRYVSKRNLKLLLGNEYSSDYAGIVRRHKDIAEVVEGLDLVFVHNTSQSRTFDHTSTPLVAGSLLKDIGITNGASINARNPLNRSYRHDYNVYFFVIPSFGRTSLETFAKQSQYGGRSLITNRQKVGKHGWTSAYFMYMHDIRAMKELFDLKIEPGLSTRQKKQLDIDNYDFLQFFDYTPQDLAVMFRVITARQLLSLKNSSKRKFSKMLNAMKKGKFDENDFSFGVLEPQLGVQEFQFEFKVPLGLPPNIVKSYDQLIY